MAMAMLMLVDARQSVHAVKLEIGASAAVSKPWLGYTRGPLSCVLAKLSKSYFVAKFRLRNILTYYVFTYPSKVRN